MISAIIQGVEVLAQAISTEQVQHLHPTDRATTTSHIMAQILIQGEVRAVAIVLFHLLVFLQVVSCIDSPDTVRTVAQNIPLQRQSSAASVVCEDSVLTPVLHNQPSSLAVSQ